MGIYTPTPPIYNYMDGHNMDRMLILSAATGEVLEPEDHLQWHHSHAVTQVGKEYVLKPYNQNGNQYTMQDYLDGQVEYPPPMSVRTTGYDHDTPDADITMDQPDSKKKRYN